VAAGDERGCRLTMTVEALRLKIRTVRAAQLRALVPAQPQPPQSVEDPAHHVGRRAFGVGVFDAEDECATVAAGIEPVEERRTCATDVQIAGR